MDDGARKARVDLVGNVAELVLCAPPLNLFDDAMIGAVETAVDELRGLVAAGSARAVLFRAEGKAFCAGVDVHEFQAQSRAQGAALMARYLHTAQSLEALAVPTVAVVHALNLTIGFELALACDLMWAGESARLGLVEATVGLTPGAGGTQRLVGRAGPARAAEAILTGRIYPAETLREWGVVNTVVADDELLARARAFVGSLADGPTVAAGIGKRLVLTARDQGIAAADQLTPLLTGRVFETEDLQRGVSSLLEHGPGQATYVGR